jgi:hypothetical protein
MLHWCLPKKNDPINGTQKVALRAHSQMKTKDLLPAASTPPSERDSHAFPLANPREPIAPAGGMTVYQYKARRNLGRRPPPVKQQFEIFRRKYS